MKIRIIVKLSVALSVILFCIGIGFYGFARLSATDRYDDVELLAYVPEDCYGLFEADNLDYFMHGFSELAYASQLDTLQRAGLIDDVLDDLSRYSSSSAHGLSPKMNHLLISFHAPGKPEMIAYFHSSKEGKKQLVEAVRKKYGGGFHPKKETYRGEKIEIYPVAPTKYLSVYSHRGVLAVSYQKKLIERVIDTQKDHTSLLDNEVFSSIHRPKSANYMAIYGRTASLPFLYDVGQPHCWSEFDIHLNSEVFYLSGAMYASDSCMTEISERLSDVHPVSLEGSFLLLSGTEKVDSCVSRVIASPFHSLFDECTANLSREASYIMVADMDKVAAEPEKYAAYLPAFVSRHLNLFRSFILSVQITKVENRLSHIFVFTYKE